MTKRKRARQRHLTDAPRRSRRLRKKLRVGEFKVLGFAIAFVFRDEVGDGAAFACLDAFVEEAIEAQGLRVRGLVFPGRKQAAVVSPDGPGSVTPGQRAAVQAWLEKRPELDAVRVGELADLNTLSP
jgi:uncharacterized protein